MLPAQPSSIPGQTLMWFGWQDCHHHFQTQEKHCPLTVLSEAVAQEALHVHVPLVHAHLSTGGKQAGFHADPGEFGFF